MRRKALSYPFDELFSTFTLGSYANLYTYSSYFELGLCGPRQYVNCFTEVV